MKETELNWFRPLWRRIAVLVVCLIWVGFEAWHGEQLWILISGGLTAYAVWNFFITFDKQLKEKAVTKPEDNSDAKPEA